MTDQNQRTLSRRTFLKGAGSLTAALALREPADKVLAKSSESESTDESFAVLIDLTRCSGCRSCEVACREANDLLTQPDEPTQLAADTWTYIDFVPLPTVSTEPLPVKRQCMHCIDPACASACPVAALHKTPEGPVAYRENRCMGCRYCMIACPFDVPKFEWDSGLRPVIGKCTMCVDRLEEGLQPACVEECPTGALKFGSRNELLAEAKGRIQADTERYVDHVYGETEVGGTFVLYLSGVPFQALGFRTDLPEEPLPALTWEVLSKLPALVLGLGVVLGGASFITHRRELMEHESEEE